jgi:hypothetical protein
MTPIQRFLSIAILSAVALVATAAPSSNATEGFVTLSYPLAVKVESEYVPTAIHLKFDIKRYDASFDAFAARTLDAREAKFASWMKAVRGRDYAKAESLFTAPRTVQPSVEKSAEHSRVIATNRTPKNVVDMYYSAFGGLRDVTVVAQILAGSKSLFIWEAKGGESQVRRAFSVDQNLSVSEVTMSTPVELLIVNNVMDRAARDPKIDRGVPGLDAQYEFPFPIDGPWTAGPHPVVIQFSGKPVDIPIIGEGAAPDPVSALYRSAYGELRARNVEKFLEYFTPKSRAKWQNWYLSLTPDAFNQFVARTTAARSIKFILDASPLLLVFHGDAGNWQAGSLQYDYIVKSPAGTLQFANVAYSSFFDDVIGSPSLFDQNVLRPAQSQ